MAEFSTSDIVNSNTVAPDSDAIAARLTAERTLNGPEYNTQIDRVKLFQLSFFRFAVAPSATSDSNIVAAPFPCRIRFVDLALETLGASASLTIDVQVNHAGAGYGSMLDAVETMTAGATEARVAPETTFERDLAQGDLIKLICVAGAGGTGPVGITGRMWLEPL